MRKKRSLPTGIYQRTVAGSTYYQVAIGKTPDGKPKLASAITLEDAKMTRKLYERAKEQHGTGLYLLDSKQQADALSAFEMLKPYPTETLVAAVGFYIKSNLSLKRGQTMQQLGELYVNAQKKNWKTETLLGNRSNLNKFITHFADRHPSTITVENIVEWDEQLTTELGEVSRVNVIGIASSFFRWLLACGYVTKTVFDPIAFKRPKIHRGEIHFLDTLDKCKTTLRVFAKHGLQNYAVLGLFLGIRPKEVRKLRDGHFKIDGDRIVIRLDANITKTLWSRTIYLKKGDALGDCGWAWLAPEGKLELPDKIAPCDRTYKRLFAKLKPELGFDWNQGAMRHTALTYHFEFYGSAELTAKMAGNSPKVLKDHYVGLTESDKAKAFYALRPAECLSLPSN